LALLKIIQRFQYQTQKRAPKRYTKRTSGRNEEYAKKLRDVRWQQMRLRVFERDEWQCKACFMKKDISLHAHHMYYRKGADPWDYPLEAFGLYVSHAMPRNQGNAGKKNKI
jgi:hypothetical protein